MDVNRTFFPSLNLPGSLPLSLSLSLMRQFLTDDAKDDVLTAWRGLKLEKGESMQKYVDKFWDRHLKATVFKRIDFSEQK